jgi:hypothetical protein
MKHMKTTIAIYRRIALIGCMVLIAGIAGAQEPVPEPPAKQPPTVQRPAGKLPVMPNKVARSSGKIFIQENSWDFGHVPQDVQVSHRFTIENVGDDTLFLERIKPT